MNASIILYSVLLGGLTALSGIRESVPSSLTVTVTDLRNDHGMVCMSVFGRDGFPKSGDKAIRTEYATIVGGKSTLTFTDLPAGEYAVSVFHDENNNKKLETNLLGIPNEGVGASNNARGHYGPPRYDDAKFTFSGNEQSVRIRIAYL
jgi:uncharacterized protein (DUF2141 family)